MKNVEEGDINTWLLSKQEYGFGDMCVDILIILRLFHAKMKFFYFVRVFDWFDKF